MFYMQVKHVQRLHVNSNCDFESGNIYFTGVCLLLVLPVACLYFFFLYVIEVSLLVS